ncbi:peptide/nickel transport system permease protein [Pseudonocardia thermophila]|uniref:Peptide/nickel transport system permease protein n=1 Tax=Pseudonocardia thermophila TaxID=1848 RepID=A0A1M6UYI9_PSETH|nr:ABC transporter permease [Pseudonocardia thermophila]SHK74273.1 peptide/nickel transport system permease protein [Pseudonocardia thermophila]
MSPAVRAVAARLAHLLVVLALVSLAATLMLDLTPVDPAIVMLGEQATPEQVAQVHAALGLDRPFLARYANWVAGLLTGDFGTSYRTKVDVLDAILAALAVTGELIVLSLLVALAVSIPIGILTAHHRDDWFDRLWVVVSSALVSCPPFVSALVLVFVFALLARDWPVHFPATGWTAFTADPLDNLWHAALPVVTLALVLVPNFSRVLRSDLVATLDDDFVLFAKAKGLPMRRVLLRHALRPSSLSLVTVAGISIGQLMGGAVVVEVLFGLPGLGQLLVNAITLNDLPLVQGAVVFIAAVYVAANAAVDLCYRVLDPRLRVAHGVVA